MITRTLFAALVFGAGALLSGNASAMSCGPADDALSGLKEKFGEVPAFTATVRGMKVVVTVSPKGTWTMLAYSPDGSQVCGLADGEGWAPKIADVKPVEPKAEPQALPTPALLPFGLLRI